MQKATIKSQSRRFCKVFFAFSAFFIVNNKGTANLKLKYYTPQNHTDKYSLSSNTSQRIKSTKASYKDKNDKKRITSIYYALPASVYIFILNFDSGYADLFKVSIVGILNRNEIATVKFKYRI